MPGLVMPRLFRSFFLLGIVVTLVGSVYCAEEATPLSEREEWWVSPEYEREKPTSVAVLPMINMSFEADVSEFFRRAVYDRLTAKGYRKTADISVAEVMRKLGVQVPEQLAGISYERLCRELQCDALLRGSVVQSATQHAGVYETVVVSCSLEMVDCPSGAVLWRCEQWRTAHRQWQIDPFNMVLSMIAHHRASREDRITWLVQEMLKTLPPGPVSPVREDLFERATIVPLETKGDDGDIENLKKEPQEKEDP